MTTVSLRLESRPCPCCKSPDLEKVFDQPTRDIIGIGDIGYHHQIQICRDCGMVFASPLLPESEIQKFYSTMSNYERPTTSGRQPEVAQAQMQRYVNLITKRFPAEFSGKALDIGCATAFGLAAFKKRGWKVLGVDPSEKCVELANTLHGVRVIKGFFPLEAATSEGPFQLVIMSHVLEHLVHPEAIVSEIAKLLTPEGLLYIEVPDLMKPFSLKCYFAFEHVNFFTPRSLANCLQRWGFRCDSVETFENGPKVFPYYPVIASTWRRAKAGEIQSAPINDYAAARKVVTDFSSSSVLMIAELERKIYSALSQVGPGKLAVWGAGIHTSQLLSETTLGESKLACIFDNDPKKAGKVLRGVQIETLGNDYFALRERVDGILISSEGSEADIFEQIKFLQGHGIKIFRLYT